MTDKRYWFPVRPARNGWGWGTPTDSRGWAAVAAFFAALVGGVLLVAPYGALWISAFSCVWGAMFVAFIAWKGEPQSMRDNSSP